MSSKLKVVGHRLWIVAALALLASMCPGIAAADLSSVKAFDIPPQPVPAALLKFSGQSGVQVTSSGEALEGKSSPGVVGRLSARAALDKLLKGTGLRYDVVDRNTIAIRILGTNKGAARAAPHSEAPANAKNSVVPTEHDPPGPDPQNATVTNNQTNTINSSSLGTVAVVGTRIRSTASAEPRPIVIMDAKQIQATGLIDLGQVIDRITSTGAATTNQVNIDGTGETEIDLRNLGSNRVLVLVNGKRWITGLDGAVDLDQIPTSVVDSVQVLQDGASAIYGSDAIAGVVNIITKKSFDGVQATAYDGGYQYGGRWNGNTQQYSVLMGAGSDQRHIMIGLQYETSNPIPACATAISCDDDYGTPFASATTPQGLYEFFPPPGSSLYSNAALCPPNASGKPFCDLVVKPGTLGNSIADFTPFTSADTYQNESADWLDSANQSTNVYAQGSYALNPNVSFHSTAMYEHHVNVQKWSYSNIVIGGGELDGSLISATNPYNPFGFDLNGNVSSPSAGVAQLVEATLRPTGSGWGQRMITPSIDTFYYNGGFDGFFSLGHRDFNWNADYVYGRSFEWTDTPTGNFNIDNLQIALGPISNCGPNTPNSTCVPFAFFGSAQQTPAMFNYVGEPNDQSSEEDTIRDYEVNLNSDDLADLPAGPLGFNVGYEYSQIGGASYPNSLDLSEGLTGPGTSGEYSVGSFYGELDVPLLAKLPLVKEMEVDLAARDGRFSSFGNNTTSQVGFKWKPDDQVLLRASWAQGFRAPDISDLFSPQSLGTAKVIDPCDYTSLPSEPAQVTANCRAAGVPASYTQPILNELDEDILQGGNPHIRPETSVSKSVGFVINPSVLPGFDLNADYFRINVNNLISSLSPINVLDECYFADIPSFCGLIKRNANGDITELVSTEGNVGDISTSGIDVGASYAFSTHVGSFRIDFKSTFTRDYDETIPNPLGGTITYHEIGWAMGETYSGFPKNKSNLSINWTARNWSAHWQLRYISALIENCTGFTQYNVCTDPNKNTELYDDSGLVPTNHLPSTTYNDASVSYELGLIHSNLTLGVNNLFNKEPPVSYTVSNISFIPTIYDLPGRYVYFRITAKF